MTLDNLLSHIGTTPKQNIDRYSEYGGPVHDHDHHVLYAYEPSGPSHGHIATSKHSYGGGHKSNASMSALTLLAFLFFLHILQQCIKDHMTEMSSTQPVMVMAAGREGEEAISKSVNNKIDKTGTTQIDDKPSSENDKKSSNIQNKVTEPTNIYDSDDVENTEPFLMVHTAYASNDQKYKKILKNNPYPNSHFSGFVSAMNED